MNENAIKSLLLKSDFKESEIFDLLSLKNKEHRELLYKKAYAVKEKVVGKRVYLRGLLEFSNICSKNCYYCGIRCANTKFKRYLMPEDEIMGCIEFAATHNYGSIVLQSGESEDPRFIKLVNDVLKKVRDRWNSKVGVTLCVGEQDESVYEEFLNSGATRYLLRIESSQKKLYEKLHPKNHSFERRMNCLKSLQRLGYQTGTGVMIGLPSQSIEDLCKDLLFFRDFSIDMVGMGPFIEHIDADNKSLGESLYPKEERFTMALNMIAILRILMPDVNIAATTALQALDPIGRERGLLSGANVIMPNLTPLKYRADYLLYEDKPCTDENSEDCHSCLSLRVASIGEEIAFKEKGDPLHFFNRIKGS